NKPPIEMFSTWQAWRLPAALTWTAMPRARTRGFLRRLRIALAAPRLPCYRTARFSEGDGRHDGDRRRPRPRDPGQPRQPDPRMRSDRLQRIGGPRRGPQRRKYWRTRGPRAARW